MRADFTVLLLTLFGSAAASVIEPARLNERIDGDSHSEHELFKRRGGGGGGGRGGGGGGSSSGGSRSSGSGSSSSSSSSKSSSGSSLSPNSGSTRRYGGGYYAGGGASPYPAGRKSKKTGLVPFFLLGAALAFWPGLWIYGAYMYHREDDNAEKYKFHNDTSGKDEELDVICACARFAQCGCEDNMDDNYLDALVGDGDYKKLDKDVVNVAVVNGTKTLLINGTLPNGTTDATNADGSAAVRITAANIFGLWPTVAAVVAAVYML